MTTANQIYASKDVGSGIVVVPNLVVSDGNGGNNYSIQPVNATGTINQKPLTVVGSTASDRPYDSTMVEPLGGAPAFLATEAAGSGSTSDGKPYNVDGVSTVGPASGMFDTPDVGANKPVTVSGVTITGTGSGNYAVVQQTGLNADVTPAVVTVGGSKTYDGTAAVSSPNLTVANKYGSDDVSLTGNAVLASKNAGPEPITAPGFPAYGSPTRVQVATGNTGSGRATTFAVNMGTAPANGNTMIAVIATRSTSG